MKTTFFLFTFLLFVAPDTSAQVSCSKLKDYVESKDYGITYYSYSSSAVDKVSFHSVTDDSYNTHYFAIVNFVSSFTEYIYQVDSSTKFDYSMDYLSSAGKAFQVHIQPYNEILGCAPSF
jgi:hypothetical protein